MTSIILDFSSETREVRRQWYNILKILKKKINVNVEFHSVNYLTMKGREVWCSNVLTLF